MYMYVTYNDRLCCVLLFRPPLPPWAQALEWLDETGEVYLSSHGAVGETQRQSEELLKEHMQFKVTAKVRRSFSWWACDVTSFSHM